MLSGLFRKFLKIAWFIPGFLLWAAFPPMGEKTDVLFALAPLLWLSRRTDARTSAKRWFMSGAFFWVATLNWMPAIVKNGGPWPLVVLGWFALAAYCAAYFAAYGWLSARYWTWARGAQGGRYGWRLLGIFVVEPVLWCGLELVRSRFLGGFAWNQLGVVAANGGFGAPAAVGGVYLLSAVIILINGTFAGIVERAWHPEKSGFPLARRVGPLETLLAFALVYGVYALGPKGVACVGGEARFVKVAMIQRNFPCVFKAREENPYDVYRQLLTNVEALKPDLVVLAESAMCEFGPVDQQGALRFAEWVIGKTGAAVLAGGTHYTEGKTFNSAALYQTTTERPNLQTTTELPNLSISLSLYDKVHLVPFGEFIPGDKLFPILQKLAPVGSCTPGEVKVLELKGEEDARRSTLDSGQEGSGIPFGVAICFEDTDSALMREFAARGAKFLCFITNDSWFSHSIESEQHAWQATARAIETGLPVVRVGNSGVTGTIAPDGKTSWLVDAYGRAIVDRRGTMFDRIQLDLASRPTSQVLGQSPESKVESPTPSGAVSAPKTPYVRLGDAPLFFAFLLLTLSMVLVKYKAHYEKRRTLSM